ncbi:hypothetical protein CK203_038050 [Vitis vinifera]|uniref:Uncharacterized protein n=1 Tax=Vitis vinifera TaxID=29760 RepID=A0A438HNJ7_VITVI|nr:hypothetical protein CK203_038050 [Vitis vinifera]
MAALLYFEEKVHRKKLLRADAIPLLFPRLLCQILEHLGYPAEPHMSVDYLSRDFHSRQMDQYDSLWWCNQGAPAGPEHPEQPEEPIDIPADTQPPAPVVASSEPTPEVPPSAPQATPQPPPIIPPHRAISFKHPHSADHSLRAHQEQIVATQAQHTAILRQIQHHLGIISAPEHAIPAHQSHHRPLFRDQPMPPEEPPAGEAEAEVPLPPYNLNRSCHIEDNVQLGWGES